MKGFVFHGDRRAKLAGLIHAAEWITATIGLVGWAVWVVSDERARARLVLRPRGIFPPLPPADLPSVYDKRGLGPGPIERTGRPTVRMGEWVGSPEAAASIPTDRVVPLD